MGKSMSESRDAEQDAIAWALQHGLAADLGDPQVRRYCSNRKRYLRRRERGREYSPLLEYCDRGAPSCCDDPVTRAHRAESNKNILQVLGSALTRTQFSVITAVVWEGYSPIEAAGVLCLNVNTVYTNLRRGMERLKVHPAIVASVNMFDRPSQMTVLGASNAKSFRECA